MRGPYPALATVLIPRFQNSSQMAPDKAPDQVQFPSAEAMAAGKLKRLEPELAGLVLAFHMDVRQLAAVEACEKEPVRPGNTSDSRHLEPALPPGTQRAIAYLNREPLVGCRVPFHTSGFLSPNLAKMSIKGV